MTQLFKVKMGMYMHDLSHIFRTNNETTIKISIKMNMSEIQLSKQRYW